MKRFRSSGFSAPLAAVMVFSFMGAHAWALGVSDISTLRAYTGATFYGQGVVKVEVTYNQGVDLSGVSAENYVLEDRGSLIPDFGQVPIASVDVSGQVVTLNVDVTKSAATEHNSIDNSSRERNVFGIYPTGQWYRDATEKKIHFNSSDYANVTGTYEPNDTAMGYWSRDSLELRLRHSSDKEEDFLCLADEKGAYTGANKWLETLDDLAGFTPLEELEIPSTASAAGDGTADDYVRGYYYVPDNYDPSSGIVFTIQGQGISYWQLEDGTNNVNTGFYYDNATRSWADKGAIVVNIHDRSSAARAYGNFWNVYDFVVDDVKVMKYFIDRYGITGPVVLQGNSRGTFASATIIKALAGQPYNPHNQDRSIREEETYSLDPAYYGFTIDAFICQNGQFGFAYDDEDWNAVADTGLRVWAIEGEQDTFSNVESIATYTALTAERYGQEWAAENVRLTCHNSEIYHRWGESDHSTTRINGYYFANEAYYGPSAYVDDAGELQYTDKLSDGDRYQVQARYSAADSTKKGYVYTLYGDSFQLWALSGRTEPRN